MSAEESVSPHVVRDIVAKVNALEDENEALRQRVEKLEAEVHGGESWR